MAYFSLQKHISIRWNSLYFRSYYGWAVPHTKGSFCLFVPQKILLLFPFLWPAYLGIDPWISLPTLFSLPQIPFYYTTPNAPPTPLQYS